MNPDPFLLSERPVNGPPQRPVNAFEVLLGLATVAFGHEDTGELWLLTEHPAWGCVPLHHARSAEGFREVEAVLRGLITSPSAPAP